MRFADRDCYMLLALFADGKEHDWFQTINLGVRHFKVYQREFEAIFKRGLEYGLIKRVVTPEVLADRQRKSYVIGWESFNYKITERGDECFRLDQIRRQGDFSFYRYYDRTIDGSWGANKFAPISKNLVRVEEQKGEGV